MYNLKSLKVSKGRLQGKRSVLIDFDHQRVDLIKNISLFYYFASNRIGVVEKNFFKNREGRQSSL